MVATPLTVIATDAWEQALFDSESRYFEAGADNTPCLGGTLSVMRGLAALPAGCVLHGVDGDRPGRYCRSWLREVETRFREAGSPLCRLYLPAGTGHLNQSMLDAGYRPVRELGMIGELDDDTGADTDPRCLATVEDDTAWDEKSALYRLAGRGPDGHDMQDGIYADLERAKSRTGYMRCYLFVRDGLTLGTASLALSDGFARLKNVLVHPSFRNQGVGRDMVRTMQHEARRLGAIRFGCLVSSKAALRVYRECGMWDMCFHTEWSRPL